MINYPNLRSEEIIAIDIETFDSLLKTHGPNYPSTRLESSAYVLGVAIATRTHAEYYNLGHVNRTNTDQAANIAKNKAYIQEVFDSPNKKIGANLAYELAFYPNIQGELIDVLGAEYNIEQNKLIYSLESLLSKYVGETKQDNKTIAVAERMGCFKGKQKDKRTDARPFLYLMDYEDVRDYALGDVRYLFDIWEKQQKKVHMETFQLDMDMLRVCDMMFRNGTPIDMDALDTHIIAFEKEIQHKQNQITDVLGQGININSNKQLKEAYDHNGFSYIVEEKTGNAKFKEEFLREYKDPISPLLLEYSKTKKILDGQLLKCKNLLIERNGITKVHGQFKPILTHKNNGGTVSGRITSKNPNIQGMAKQIKNIFVPLPEHTWGSIDLSQIEYRSLVHFAVGRGAEEARFAYNQNPDTDYHQFVMDLTGLDRKQAKICNFLSVYRGGVNALAKQAKCSYSRAKALQEIYFSKLPFVKETAKAAEMHANRYGKIKTLLGRELHFRDSREEWKAFSWVNQGSAAEILKKGLQKAYKEGLFDILTLHNSVHDENNVSIPPIPEGMQAFEQLQNCMETAVKMRVPIRSEAATGKNWQKCK